jgi:hypothetical protein
MVWTGQRVDGWLAYGPPTTDRRAPRQLRAVIVNPAKLEASAKERHGWGTEATPTAITLYRTCVRYRTLGELVSGLPKPRLRHFDQVRRELEHIVFRLQNAPQDPKLRRKLLRQLRLLLDEADRIIASEEL